MKKKKLKKLELPHYFICSDCAKERGGRWPECHCATMHYDKCEYCGRLEQALCATTDYLWGKEKTLKVWD